MTAQKKIATGWISVLAFILPFHWLPFLIIGINLNNIGWIILSIIYLIPVLLYVFFEVIHSSLAESFEILVVIMWVVAFINSFFVSDKYTKLLRKKRQMQSIKRRWSFHKDGEIISTFPEVKQQALISMYNIKSELKKEYDKLTPLVQNSFIDFVVKADDYIEKSIGLLISEIEIDKKIGNYNEKKLKEDLKNYTLELKKAVSDELKNVLSQNIEESKNQLTTFEELVDKQNNVKEKIESLQQLLPKLRNDFFLKLKDIQNNLA